MRFQHLMHARRRRLRRWIQLSLARGYPPSQGADEPEERPRPSDKQKRPRTDQFDAVLPFWRFRQMNDRVGAGRADYAEDLEHEDLEDDDEDLRDEDLEDQGAEAQWSSDRDEFDEMRGRRRWWRNPRTVARG